MYIYKHLFELYGNIYMCICVCVYNIIIYVYNHPNRITPALALALAPVLLDFPVGRFTAQVSYPTLSP